MEIPFEILIFKTDIKTEAHKHSIGLVLDAVADIRRWTVDCEDCDCVLRIETTQLISTQIQELVSNAGFICEELTH
ncbi:hypothetical protein P1X15_22785 [Runella sp. MFBS21]|uniref:hypothetical protein n=1 Tax=Runella sp. MFBS21 TaxID=3034018 RepID=UPI0023F9A3B1|nr:hypothetical protein [Runella sp. MFBS21]MDF7820467.1 hypothetical protein [Runella sp. MFBS21]